MEFKHFLAAALTLAVVCSQPVELERDQYENREDKPHAFQPLSEATDSTLSEPRRLDYTEKETNTSADSLSDGKRGEPGRAKREFSRWNGRQTQSVGHESFAMWKPPVYQLSRPYFIPIYGAPGRIPIYFPPQSLNINPGTPLDNPLPNRPFKGPVYLPPKDVTTEDTTMRIRDRFNEDDEDDDRPIWGDAPSANAPAPSNVIPTRPPRPTGMASVPPLLHDVNNGGTNFLAAESEDSQPSPLPTPSSLQSARPVQSTPRSAGPSNCVWAIVSCCSVSSTAVPESCFEQRGCAGPFWGSSPCDDGNVRAAIAAASNYFGK